MRPKPDKQSELVALLIGCLLLSACSGPPNGAAGAGAADAKKPRPPQGPPLEVAVSIPPLAWLVDRLGGERVRTQVLLPPGSSPTTYEPSPRQVVALDRARLFVAVGHPDFPFERRLLDRLLAHRENLPVVAVTSGLGDMALGHDHGPHADGHGHETELDHEADPNRDIDPHVWVAPAAFAAVAETVARALAERDPEGADLYLEKLAALRKEITRLERQLDADLGDLPRRRFWVYHPAWGYLARQYGLEQVALEAGGKELSPRRLVALIERARQERVAVIFVQRGFSDRAARALAELAGARVEVLDPLAYDWPENLRSVATQLRKALADETSNDPLATH